MDIVTLGAALNGSAEYVNSHFKGGSNIQIVDNPDGTQTINASGEVSSEDTVARAEIAAIKDGETLDSFGDVETALDDKADTLTTYTKTEVDTALSAKANTATTYTKTEVDTALGGKVDKETGKGLSTNDYTTAEKTKLAGIAEGAEVNGIVGIKVNNTTVNPDVNKVVNITVPTTAADVSALPNTTKYAAALSLTINSSTFVMTGQLKDQNGDNLGTPQPIDLPLESVVVGGRYDSQTKKVVLTLQNGNTIEFSVADLVSGLQTELSASNKLNPAYIDYDSTHRAVSDTEKSAWNGKQDALSSAQLAAVNSGIDSTKVAQIETNKNNILSVADQSTKYNIAQGRARTLDSVTSTVSGYTITFSGTSSGTRSFSFLEPFSPPKSGDYVWKYTNGVTIGGTPISVYMWDVTANVGVNATDIEGGLKVNLNSTHLYTLAFGLQNNAVVSGNYSVMIISKDLWDKGFTDFQPYALPNITITPALKECVDNGAKNRLPTTSTTTSTNNGLTLVVNSDYSITITGTMTTVENTDMYFIGSWVNTSPFANYTGKNMQIYCKSPTSIDGQFKMYDRTAKKTYAVAINNNEGTNISGDLTAAYFTIAATADAINVTLYPMICEPSSYIVSQQYIPPAMSNAELTAEVKPPAYSNPTPQSTDITLQSGGYYKIGNSVTVCIRATVSNALAAWAPIFSGLPVPITDSSIAENSAVVAVSSNAGVGIGITKRGIMQGFDVVPAGTLLLNCTYLCV